MWRGAAASTLVCGTRDLGSTPGVAVLLVF